MKKLKLSMIFAAVALLAIGCSNLWDYDPPKTNTPPPITPSDPSGTPPSSNQKMLTFWVFDGNGEKQKIEIAVSSGTEKVTAAEIKKAIKEKYPQLLKEENWPEGFDLDQTDGDFVLYESDLSKPASASDSYESGTVLALGFTPKKIGYTSSITTAGGGKREFLTDVSWGESEQPLSKILEKAGIEAGGDNKYTPIGDNAPPSTDWEFQGWAKADDPTTTILTPADSTTYPSGTNFVAVYTVPYEINIDGTKYTVNVQVTAPNEGATWEQIKAAALALPDSTIPDAAKDKLDTLTWGAKKPGETKAAEFEGGVQFPANTSFEAFVEYKYKITDANGKEVEVDFGLLPSTTEKKLSDIIEKAIQDANKRGEAVDFGSTHDGSGNVSITNWTDGTNNIADGATGAIAPGAEIKPNDMELAYKVDGKDVTVTVTYPETEATWEQIKTAAKAQYPSEFDESKLWKDVNDKLVSDVKKYPAGTSFTSSDSVNASTGGSAERVVTVADPMRTPQPGDKLYKDPNGKGWIIAKAEDHPAEPSGPWDLLGYVYKVDSETVKVVSAVTGDARWARQPGAVYDGKQTGKDNLAKFLSDKGATNGYDAWIGIGGNFEINADGAVVNKGNKKVVSEQGVEANTAWNPNALFRNYDAISWALCYPASEKKRNELSSNHPLYSETSDKNILEYLQNGSGNLNAYSWTKEVVKIVNGDTVESRWYLPSVAELQEIYNVGEPGDVFLNWDSDLKDNKFWSVQPYLTDPQTDADEKLARYVDFSNGNEDKMNKYGEANTETPGDNVNNYNRIKVLAVAQFNWTTM